MRSDVGSARCIGMLRQLLALAVAVFFSACSIVRIGYELAPWYTARQLGAYWQLDSVRSAFARERIDELWSWHRRSELPPSHAGCAMSTAASMAASSSTR